MEKETTPTITVQDIKDHFDSTEPMMPPPKRIGNVRIEIGKKTPLWPVQNLHTPHGKPVLPPIKGRSMTQ